MDRETRNSIQRATQAARQLVEHEYAEQLEGVFDIRLDGTVAAESGGTSRSTQRALRAKLSSGGGAPTHGWVDESRRGVLLCPRIRVH